MKTIKLIGLLLSLSILFTQCTPSASIVTDKEPTFFADEGCPDLHILELKEIERKKSDIYIEYTLINKGDAAVSLIGLKPKKKKDNLAIKMYFSSDNKLQPGDVLVGGVYLDNKAMAENNGKLEPGKTYKGTIKVSLKKQTSFTPFIVFDVDAWQTITECDETNNENAFEVK